MHKGSPTVNYVYIRKINSLIADDYTNNNHPLSTLSGAAQHLAGKSLFCKLDCSQAYHCLQMADQRSVEMPAINFAIRNFAYKRLAQRLSRSVSAFSSFMREYLDPVVKADQCAQYVDDIGIAANNATDLTRNIRAVFECFRQAGLKLIIEKGHFGVRQVEFLGRIISPKGISSRDPSSFLQEFPRFFPHFTMQVKMSSSGTNAKPEPLITVYALSIPPTTTKTIKAFVDHPSKWNTTGTVTPLQKFTDRASLLISQSKSIIIDKRLALRVTNTTESPYLIKKHTQIAEFSAVTPEQ